MRESDFKELAHKVIAGTRAGEWPEGTLFTIVSACADTADLFRTFLDAPDFSTKTHRQPHPIGSRAFKIFIR